jgi:hypothetical protein
VISKISGIAAAVFAAAGLAAVVPASASASVAQPANMVNVECGPSNYLQVWYHADGQGSTEDCYTATSNGGGPAACYTNNHKNPVLERMLTGSNSVQYQISNGGPWLPNPVLGPNTEVRFANVPFTCIRIL